ncbi:MAG TPA: hypothetical protein VF094_08240 [Gaiellaceae bacterium]
MRRSVRVGNPFEFLFATTRREQYLERYVLHEHRKGRALADILEDPYIRSWSTPEERARLLERPAVVAVIGSGILTVMHETKALHQTEAS